MKTNKVLFFLFLSILCLFAVGTESSKSQVSGIIYITSNGSIYTSTNAAVPIQQIGNVYTFNDSIIGYSIVVQRDNIIIEGAGFTFQGTGGGVGIDLSYRSNVTIKNMQIMGGFNYGIYVFYSFNTTIAENKIANTINAIQIENASNNIFSSNNLINSNSGFSMFSSSNNKFRNNIMNNNFNFAVYGTELSHFLHDVDVSNMINGKKVYYLIDEKDLTISPSAFPDVAFLALVNCTSITVQNLELTDNGQGIMLAFTTNSIVTQNLITNNMNGVWLCSSSSNMISGNYIETNYKGIQLTELSSRNNILSNNITDNGNSIYIFDSSANTITENNITNSDLGIGFSASSFNMIYHNNFTNNKIHVYDSHMDHTSITLSVNNWDFGYPLGGNYWSDYTGLDVKSGPNQDQFGSDGIGDTPYIIYENNKDNYPLMPYGSPPVISIISPENETYTMDHVSLAFTLSTINEPISWIGYSLDGQANVTIAGNTTLSGLLNGVHNLIVYAKDADGNTGASETINFTLAQQLEPFPTTWIAVATAIIAVIGISLLVYFVKIRERTKKVKNSVSNTSVKIFYDGLCHKSLNFVNNTEHGNYQSRLG